MIGFLRANRKLLKKATREKVREAFKAETGLAVSCQWIGDVADAQKIPRRRVRGPARWRSAKEKLDAKRARQRIWLAAKRQRPKGKV